MFILSSFAFTVGTLSGALNLPDGFIVPGLIHSTVTNLGAFFITSGGIELHGGNTFNGGGGGFVIGNSADGGIIGKLIETPQGLCKRKHAN